MVVAACKARKRLIGHKTANVKTAHLEHVVNGQANYRSLECRQASDLGPRLVVPVAMSSVRAIRIQ